MMQQLKVPCPICGYHTLDARHDWDICPICFWEDDIVIEDGTERSTANGGLSAAEAQANFLLFGAMSRECVGKVRRAYLGERRITDWQPMRAAQAIVARLKADDDEETKGGTH